jgi:hypothetical protein
MRLALLNVQVPVPALDYVCSESQCNGVSTTGTRTRQITIVFTNLQICVKVNVHY